MVVGGIRRNRLGDPGLLIGPADPPASPAAHDLRTRRD